MHIFKEEEFIDDLGLDTFLWTRSFYENLLGVELLSSIKWKNKVFMPQILTTSLDYLNKLI